MLNRTSCEAYSAFKIKHEPEELCFVHKITRENVKKPSAMFMCTWGVRMSNIKSCSSYSMLKTARRPEELYMIEINKTPLICIWRNDNV